jgi:transcription antitermination factor NusG
MAAAEVLASTIARHESVMLAMTEPRWYAASTRSRHEKAVAEYCTQRSIANFVPLYESVRRWKNGRHRVNLPLFPGYAFVRIALANRLEVLKVPGVVRLVSFNGLPAPLGDAEIEILQRALASGQRATPHPYLAAGRRVRIKSGPLAGLEGRIVRRKKSLRFIIALDLISRASAVELEACELESVGACSRYGLEPVDRLDPK